MALDSLRIGTRQLNGLLACATGVTLCHRDRDARCSGMLEGLAKSEGGMPEPRTPRGVERLPNSLSAEALFTRFMRALGADEHRELIDAAGNRLLIDRRLFQRVLPSLSACRGHAARGAVVQITRHFAMMGISKVSGQVI